MILVAMAFIFWFFPYVVMQLNIFYLFASNGRVKKQNLKIIYRETLGETKYLIPFINWVYMVNLILYRDIIEMYLEAKLNEIESKVKEIWLCLLRVL